MKASGEPDQIGWIVSFCISSSRASLRSRPLTQALEPRNGARWYDVSPVCSLMCNCVKGAAISIASTRPHQCLMQSLSRFFICPPPPPLPSAPPLSIYGNSLSFAIDPPLAANEKELCFLGLKTGLLAFLESWLFFFLLRDPFETCCSRLRVQSSVSSLIDSKNIFPMTSLTLALLIQLER